jgi:predicted ATPase
MSRHATEAICASLSRIVSPLRSGKVWHRNPMILGSIEVKSYKSLYNAPTWHLQPGVNVIVGPNNAGKTSLLEACSLHVTDIPHRSATTVPEHGGPVLAPCDISAMLHTTPRELLSFLSGSPFRLAYPEDIRAFGEASGPNDIGPLWRWMISQPTLSLKVKVPRFDNQSSLGYAARHEARGIHQVQLSVDLQGAIVSQQLIVEPQISYEIGTLLLGRYHSHSYIFRAERFNLGSCAIGTSTELQGNAANLAEVLHNLQANVARYRRFNEAVTRVLPQIRWVSVHLLGHAKVSIRIWQHSPNGERDDLAVSLDESGTGVGQILAILYIVMNAHGPRTIMIDEPQSFLHPGAIRRLLELLAEHPKHQYVMSTHSPTVISAAQPSSVVRLTQSDGVTSLVMVEAEQHEQLRDTLQAIGVSAGDVFGAEGIVWVEGPTEERCFPMILRAVMKKPLLGKLFLAVKHTGDLDSKHARLALDIYSRLSVGSSVLSPALAFILDREDRTAAERARLQAHVKAPVRFTNRRLYENYLLNPRAIAAVANAIDGFSPTPMLEGTIAEWLVKESEAWLSGERPRYGKRPKEPFTDPLYELNAARLLERLFLEFSETRVAYDKLTHSVALTRWLCESEPAALKDIVALIENLF